jgi:glucose-6-phosphate 1-dehydrogenase
MKEKKLYPAAITIFGAKGDLTHRKLIPAIYNLYIGDHLPADFSLFCVDYLPASDQEFRNYLLGGVNEFSRSGKADEKKWAAFSARINYIHGDFLKIDTFNTLKEKLDSFDKGNTQRGTRMFYYAVAPRFIEVISDSLYKLKLCHQKQKDRIVVEKPFGTDLDSSKELNRFLGKRFAESQIYRIDHYLGKETVQNILAFRFANYVFEPLWNNKYIDHVQISVAESVGVGKRGGYYDSAGALRDMIQNHLLQLLCIVAMECPDKYQAEMIRNSKTKLMQSMRIYTGAPEVFKNVVRGQYTAGTVDGKPVPAYRDEEQVASGSTTDTFVAAKFFIDNKRWKDVPFFLGTGKSLPRQTSVIAIQFKDSPHKIFKDDVVPNRLIISIQPELEICLLFESKVPGLEMKLQPVNMDFIYQENYKESIPEAYEALILDVLEGDATLFMRADQVDAAWKVVMPILNAWKKFPAKQLHFYEAGSWGPSAARELVKPYAEHWCQLPVKNKGILFQQKKLQ